MQNERGTTKAARTENASSDDWDRPRLLDFPKGTWYGTAKKPADSRRALTRAALAFRWVIAHALWSCFDSEGAYALCRRLSAASGSLLGCGAGVAALLSTACWRCRSAGGAPGASQAGDRRRPSSCSAGLRGGQYSRLRRAVGDLTTAGTAVHLPSIAEPGVHYIACRD